MSKGPGSFRKIERRIALLQARQRHDGALLRAWLWGGAGKGDQNMSPKTPKQLRKIYG